MFRNKIVRTSRRIPVSEGGDVILNRIIRTAVSEACGMSKKYGPQVRRLLRRMLKDAIIFRVAEYKGEKSVRNGRADCFKESYEKLMAAGFKEEEAAEMVKKITQIFTRGGEFRYNERQRG